MAYLCLTLLLAVILNFANADRVLVLVDNPSIRNTHSIFLKSLEERGHQVTISMADDANLSLISYGESNYDHLIIFAPSVEEFGGSINVAEITKFIDIGGNVLLAGGPNVGDAVRDLVTEVGFEVDEDKTEVIDHHNFYPQLDNGHHTTIVVPASNLINSKLIVGNKDSLNSILYRGVALISNPSNNLRLEILTAPTTAFSFIPATVVDEYPAAIGRSTVLVGAIQARNNARVVVTGSLDMFADEFINAVVGTAKSGNLNFVTSLSQWVLKEVGVLRVESVQHHKIGETKPPTEYTIMEDVFYEINIQELQNGQWVPFQGKDVQLEFVRIDPFVRTTLKNKNGKLSTVFKVPDVYGVFKFLVDYRRVGYTHLYNVQQVSVRPLTHTQYERFSICAYPYYVSAFSMMLGVFLFSFVFLYYKEKSPVQTASVAKNTQKNK